jgi:type II secretory pathway pseudopilin PulG
MVVKPVRLRQILQGIGLLEMMLVLAIIAVLLLVSVRYYGNANAEQEANALVNSYNTIKSAVQTYLANNPGSSVPTMTVLVSGGYLPDTYLTTTGSGNDTKKVSLNIWGGNITITSAVDGTFSITQAAIPQAVCTMSYGQLKNSINTNLNESITVNPAMKDNQCQESSSIIAKYSE